MEHHLEQELKDMAALFAAEEAGQLTILRFSTVISKQNEKQSYSFEEIVTAYHRFEWDIHWWAMIRENKALELTASEAAYLEKWQQILSFPPTQHIVRVISRQSFGNSCTMRTIAIPFGRAGIKMSYIAEYIVEDLGDSAKLSLVGKLKIPSYLQAILEMLIKLIGEMAFARMLKGFFYSGMAKNLLNSKR